MPAVFQTQVTKVTVKQSVALREYLLEEPGVPKTGNTRDLKSTYSLYLAQKCLVSTSPGAGVATTLCPLFLALSPEGPSSEGLSHTEDESVSGGRHGCQEFEGCTVREISGQHPGASLEEFSDQDILLPSHPGALVESEQPPT